MQIFTIYITKYKYINIYIMNYKFNKNRLFMHEQ